MKTGYIQLIKITVFSSIFCLLFSNMSDVFIHVKEDTSSPFYALPENSLDAIFLGASTYYAGISPLDMWEDYGFTGYVRGSSAQAPVVSYYFLAESLKVQKPEVVVIDVSALFSQYDMNKKEGKLRVAIDPMRFSAEKLGLIKDVVSLSDNQTAASYLFPLLRYHSRWNGLSHLDYDDSDISLRLYQGFYGLQMGTKIVEYPEVEMQPTDVAEKYNRIALNYYEKMIQLCLDNDIDVVLLTLPRMNWSYSKHLGVQQLADEYDVMYIDYCIEKNWGELGLDNSTDFRDTSHLNMHGAKKVAYHLGAYLQQTYNLEDRRDDPNFQQWNIDLQVYKDDITEAIASNGK